MKRSLIATATWLGAAVLLASQPLVAQGAAPQLTPTLCEAGKEPEGTVLLEAAIAAKIAAAKKPPRAAPSAVQTTAPSDSPAAASPVDRAEIPWLAALGIGTDLVNRSNGVVNVALTPFAFYSVFYKDVVSGPDELYQAPAMRRLRRIGGSVALGGKGEELDRDGDGKPDAALDTKDLGDVVVYELQYRLWGSRDRREGIAAELRDDPALRAAMNPAFQNQIFQTLLGDPSIQLGAPAVACYEGEALDKVLSQIQYQQLYIAAAEGDAAYATALENAYERIDRRPVLTLVGGGVRRADGFGRDEDKAALRFAWSRPDGGTTHNANLEWRQLENLAAPDDASTWKLGYEYSRLVLKGSVLSKDGATLSVAGAYETYDHVADAKYDTVSTLNAKLDFPLWEGVSIPLSVTWANHESLITGEDELRAHFGFTVDFSKLQDAAKERAVQALR